MIQFHVTKKLLAKLPLNEEGFLPRHPGNEWLHDKGQWVNNPLSDWHGNLITLQRRQCVLMVHDSTRFPVFMPCLTKPDFASLDSLFADSFMNTLLKCGASEEQMEVANSLLAPLQSDSMCNRSVQGTMNRVAGDIEHHLIYNEADISELSGYRLGAWLADSPCTVKGQKECIWPDKAMLSLLDDAASEDGPHLVQAAEKPDLPSNVVSLDDYRKK